MTEPSAARKRRRPTDAPRETAAPTGATASAASKDGPADGARVSRGPAPALALRIPFDELSRLAGLTALITGILAIAGVLSTVAYLSAWSIPPPLVRLDPLTAALRSETALFQSLLLVLMLYALEIGSRRLAERPWIGRLLFFIVVALLAWFGYEAARGGYEGPFVTLGAAVSIWVAYRWGWIGQRGLLVAFALAALVGAYVNGYESGVLIRDDAQYRTPVSLATRTPVNGLTGVAIEGGGWGYDGLYLVFRDGETVYVSRPGAGAKVWLIPAANVGSLSVESPDR